MIGDPLLLSLTEIKNHENEEDTRDRHRALKSEQEKIHKLVSFFLSANQYVSDPTVLFRISNQLRRHSNKLILQGDYFKKQEYDMYSIFATEIS